MFVVFQGMHAWFWSLILHVTEINSSELKVERKVTIPESHIYTWVFDRSTRYMDDFIENLDIDARISAGFIQLSGTEEHLHISLVQRPQRWPDGSRFCAPILRAAVREFYERSGFELSKLVSVSVNNFANPREAGCRCYVRLMIQMGLDRIGGFDRLRDDQVGRFCDPETGVKMSFIEGRSSGQAARLPSEDAQAAKILKSAYFDEFKLVQIGELPSQ
jgi:hypothetical protein